MADGGSRPGSPKWWHLQPRHAVVALAVVVGIALTALIGNDLRHDYDNALEAAGSKTQDLTRVLEEHARQSLRRVHLTLSQAADELRAEREIASADPGALRRRLRALLPADGLIQEFAVIGNHGAIVLSTAAEDIYGLRAGAGRAYFEAHRGRADLGMVIGVTVKSSATGKWMLPVSYRLDAPGGAFQGVLLGVVEPAYFQSFYDSIDTGANGFVTLFTRQGWIAARSPFVDSVLSRNWADSPMFRVHLPASEARTVRQVVVADGVERIYSYRALKDYPVVVSLGLSLTDILAPWRARAWREGIVLLLALSALGAAALALVQQLRRRDTAENALRASEARFRSLTELSSDWYWEQDAHLRFVDLSSSVVDRGGSSIQYHIGKTRWELPAVGVSEERWAEHRATLDAHQPFHDFEYQRVTERGDSIWMSISGAPIFDDQGRFKGYRGIGRNIDDRQRAEVKLRETEMRLQAFMDKSPSVMFMKDSQGRYLHVNRHFTSAFGLDAEAVVGRTDAEIFPPHQAARFQANDQLVLTSRTPIEAEESAQYRDGIHTSIVSKFPIWDSEGRVAALGGIVTDITERKRDEEKLAALAADLEAKVASRTEELAKALEAATAGERTKSDFMANVTHELRTPLNSIIGFAELLKAQVPGPLNAKQAAFAADILASGQRLLALVEGILEMSRLDTTDGALKRDPVEIGAALQERVAAHRKTAEARGVTMRLDVAADAGSAEMGPKALRRMLDALLDNAIKFSREGGAVTVSARRVGGVLEIAVADTGIGIAPEDLAKLFKPLVQLDAGLARKHGGVGLGLALARRLAELQGGTIGVESEPGKGSRFTLRLPAGGKP